MKQRILVGVDIVEIERVEQAVKRFGDRFLNRLFGEEELSFYRSSKRKREGVAALFCGKEAVKKLFLSKNFLLPWREVKITHTSAGKPEVRLSASVPPLFEEIEISISHSHQFAVAVAIGVEKEGGNGGAG
ncbi:MAG TPA: holo-ACP synthase [Candidatus Atribacteria bacterium]|nr:holo-ACP synthase [Candidatus Atribacteria bacterium]